MIPYIRSIDYLLRGNIPPQNIIYIYITWPNSPNIHAIPAAKGNHIKVNINNQAIRPCTMEGFTHEYLIDDFLVVLKPLNQPTKAQSTNRKAWGQIDGWTTPFRMQGMNLQCEVQKWRNLPTHPWTKPGKTVFLAHCCVSFMVLLMNEIPHQLKKFISLSHSLQGFNTFNIIPVSLTHDIKKKTAFTTLLPESTVVPLSTQPFEIRKLPSSCIQNGSWIEKKTASYLVANISQLFFMV